MNELLFVLLAGFVAYVAHSHYNSTPNKADLPPAPPVPSPDLSTASLVKTTTLNHGVAVPPKVKNPAKKAINTPAINQSALDPVMVTDQVLPEPKPAKLTSPIIAKTPSTTRPKAKAPTPTVAKASVRNPLSGEVSSIANNYRFIKRWVKDALVTEGLLSQVYKNNEITPENEALIKSAMAELAIMDKYKV